MSVKIINALVRIEDVEQERRNRVSLKTDIIEPLDPKTYKYCDDYGGPIAVALTHEIPGDFIYKKTPKDQAIEFINEYTNRHGYTSSKPMNWSGIVGLIGSLTTRQADYLQFEIDLVTHIMTPVRKTGVPTGFLDISHCLLWGIFNTHFKGGDNPVLNFTTGVDTLKTHLDTLVIRVDTHYYDFSNNHP